ncbi:lariat debranching enzyme, C-terminal domain-containing protein [Bombardia bombarda]|uniref:Lariat debranching enzyme, C-terminal domain-containing protein n=1 Tax=Bombardia bombarda TaxID=252184 RepID=A0AA40CEY8_9PEZI|nr:lariat debranching enzyme, C-terminal domain-containing protein [Bombardia bombarda]
MSAGTSYTTTQGVRVAVEGCGHGTLNAIYAAVERSCKERGWDGVDILIIGGDFQAVRNAADLSVMSVPVKYRELGDFHEYYSGARKAPFLTVFVAGNHEAASHLWELYYGGWVAPNIYYMGAANVLRLGPLRIAAMSGIWKGFDYRKAHHERLPFSTDDVKSFYHVRELDVRKLLQVRTQVDIGMSHDWPRAVEKHGNQRHLFNMKPDFERESHDGSLGSPAAAYVMDRLRPAYWFSAHLHCKFSAVKTYDPPAGVDQTSEATESVSKGTVQETTAVAPLPIEIAVASSTAEANPDEIDLEMDDDEDTPASAPVPPPEAKKPDVPTSAPAEPKAQANNDDLRAQLPASFAKPQQQPKAVPGQPVPAGITNTTVRFLALDKCLPGRKFLQLCEIEPLNPSPTSTTSPPTATTTTEPPAFTPRYNLQYDPEWLAITRVFAPSLTVGDRTASLPPDLSETHYLPLIEAEQRWVDGHIVRANKLDVPDNFAITAPPHQPGMPELTDQQPEEYTNPQTEAFCALVGVPNVWNASEEERAERKRAGPPVVEFGGGSGRGGGHRGGGRGGGGRGGGGRGGRGRGRGRGRGGY